MTPDPPQGEVVASGQHDVGIVAFQDVAGVQAWANANGGANALRELLADQEHHFRAYDTASVRLARAWLEIDDRVQADAASKEQHALARRATEAAERSADAAHRSALWAGWALGVALAALLVSAWPHIAEWWRD